MGERKAEASEGAQAILADLRRFSNMLVADDDLSEEIVREVARSLLVSGTVGGQGAWLGALRWFHDAWAARGYPSRWSKASPFPQSIFYPLAPLARAALLLRGPMRVPAREVARILRLRDVRQPIKDTAKVVRKAMDVRTFVLSNNRTEVQTLSRILKNIGMKVLEPTWEGSDLLSQLVAGRPHLIVVGSRPPNGDAVRDLLAQWSSFSNAAVLLLTNEFFLSLPSRTYRLRANANEDDIQTVALSVLLDDLPLHWIPPDRETNGAGSEASLAEVALSLDDADLHQVHAPLLAKVERGAIESAPAPAAEQVLPKPMLEALLQDHLNDANRIRQLPSNLGERFYARLDVIIEILSEPLSETSLFRLANQQMALAHMRPSIAEMLDPRSAADIEAFSEALSLTVRQSSHWRQFLTAAEVTGRHPEAESALKAVSRIIAAQPDEVLRPLVKEIVSETAAVAEDSPSPVSERSLSTSVSNIFRAIGRYLKDRARGTSRSFNESLEKELGEGAAAALVNLIVAASTPLLVLTTQLPAEFAWIGPLLAAARTMRSRP